MKYLLILLLFPIHVFADQSKDRFHQQVMTNLEGSKKFMKLVRTSTDGKPFSFFFIVAPSDIHQHIFWNKNKDGDLYLRTITMKYGDTPEFEYITANCKEKKIDKKCYEGRDCNSNLPPELDPITGKEITVDNNVLRYLNFNKDMTKQEYADFCEIDYSDAISFVESAFMKHNFK